MKMYFEVFGFGIEMQGGSGFFLIDFERLNKYMVYKTNAFLIFYFENSFFGCPNLGEFLDVILFVFII